MEQLELLKILQISTLARLAAKGDVEKEKVIIFEITECVLNKIALKSEIAICIYHSIGCKCSVDVANELINMYGL